MERSIWIQGMCRQGQPDENFSKKLFHDLTMLIWCTKSAQQIEFNPTEDQQVISNNKGKTKIHSLKNQLWITFTNSVRVLQFVSSVINKWWNKRIASLACFYDLVQSAKVAHDWKLETRLTNLENHQKSQLEYNCHFGSKDKTHFITSLKICDFYNFFFFVKYSKC